MSKRALAGVASAGDTRPPLWPSCAFNPIGATEQVCQNTTAVIRHNILGCCRTECKSPFRLCIACLQYGARHVEVEAATGLCSFHAEHGTQVVRPADSSLGFTKNTKEPKEPDRILNTESPESVENDEEPVPEAELLAIQEPLNVQAVELFEVVDAIAVLREDGKPHADIEKHFGVASRHAGWSTQHHALRHLTQTVREYLLRMKELPSLSLLQKAAYAAKETQLECLQTLLTERETTQQRIRKVKAERTVGWLRKMVREATELHSRLETSRVDIADASAFADDLGALIRQLEECKKLIT